jgi:hypothetical protein
MGYFVYVSHRDTVKALTVSKELMIHGHFPFVPQLNRLISGRTDAEWENYFKMWLFRCDAIFLTPSYREHEKVWAKENNVPVFSSLKELHAFKFPPFSELGRKFGEKVATKLDVNEFWRKCSKEEVVKNFEHVAGLGSDPIKVAALALMVWDRKV